MSPQDTIFYQKTEQIFRANLAPIIMGILNITPDSFYDGGEYLEEGKWLARAGQMIEQGAGIIDIGACSTRPGAKAISEEEECRRLLPVIKSVRKAFPDMLISADTFRASVAEKAVAAGANIINDISGGSMDILMFPTIAQLKVPYILMHISGNPQNMQIDPKYDDVCKEVFNFFDEKLKELKLLGVEKIILDPGFGFGKTLEHNFQLLKSLDKFNSLNAPLLVGVSRKSMISKLLNISTQNSVNGTSILNTIAMERGARILRVHDVKEANEAVKIIDFMRRTL